MSSLTVRESGGWLLDAEPNSGAANSPLKSRDERMECRMLVFALVEVT